MTMIHKSLRSKLNIGMIVLLVAVSVILVTENVTGATMVYRLGQLTRVKEDVVPSYSHLARLEDIARIKDDVSPVDARLSQRARWEELVRIKDQVSPVDTRITRLARLEELARIKDDIMP
jgi:hypothetical protein